MRNIIITGANDGIGYYMANSLLERGDRVAVLDITTDKTGSLAASFPETLIALECDVSVSQQVATAVKQIEQKWGAADIAVHNACICLFTSLELTSEEDYRRVWDVNFLGATNLAKAVLPAMRARGAGKVCLTSSGVGVTGFPNLSAYAASKGALEALTKCLDTENRPYGITFHLLHPPLTRTASSDPLPVPQEMMADPKKVGRGLAQNLHKKSFVICHSAGQRIQVRLAYLLGVRMGRLMGKLTERASHK